jgi:hypothetical protein
MTIAERCNLLDAVANALEAAADDAHRDLGSVSNTMCLVHTIRGYQPIGFRDFKAAELLLEQGITLVHQ